jgi:23S rRNA (uracil-5-)-methyltransferase RumA
MSASSLQPGDQLTLTIESLVHSGEGLARHEGLPVFVPGAFPGDRVQAQVISRKPGYARALIDHLEQPSPERVHPPCPVTATCGGCQWQEYDYLAQLRTKAVLLQETLIRVGHLDPAQVASAAESPLGMEHPFGYRNKAQFPLTMVGATLEGGFYAPHSHQLVPRDRCDIQHPAINAAYAHALEGLRASGLLAYNESDQTGVLRHLVIRHGAGTGETLVGLVSTRPTLDLEAWVQHMQLLPGLVGLLLNHQPKPGNTI